MSDTLSVKEKMVEIQPGGPPEQTVEEQASAEGWHEDGKNMFGETVSAERYLQEKPLYNTIGKLKNTLGQLDTRLETAEVNQKKMAESFIEEKADLVEQLKVKKEQALVDLDTDEVRRIDKEIEQVATATQVQTETSQSQPSEKEWSDAYIGFLKDNRWYDDNPGLKSAADLYGKQYSNENKNATPQEIYKHIEDKVKAEFADRFEDKPQTTNSKVSTSNRRAASTTKTKTVKLSDFDADEQHLYKVMASALGQTVEEYLNPKKGK